MNERESLRNEKRDETGVDGSTKKKRKKREKEGANPLIFLRPD